MGALFTYNPLLGAENYFGVYGGFIFLAVILIVVMVIAVFAYFR